MGYSQPLLMESQYELYSLHKDYAQITTVAADIVLPTITIPTLSGTVKRAYYDLYVAVLNNNRAAQNTLSPAQTITVDNTAAGGDLTAITIADDSWRRNASSVTSGSLHGTNDIKAKITSGTTITPTWQSAQVDGNDFVLLDAYGVLRITVGD